MNFHPVTFTVVLLLFSLFQVKLRISRKRCEFGAPVKFGDQNTVAMREPIINCEPYEDESCILKKYELDVGIQVFVLILTRSWLLLNTVCTC